MASSWLNLEYGSAQLSTLDHASKDATSGSRTVGLEHSKEMASPEPRLGASLQARVTLSMLVSRKWQDLVEIQAP